jgi:hypothetical protein
LSCSGVDPCSRDSSEQIVRQCVEVGLVQGKHLSVDGSFIQANAAKESRIPRRAVRREPVGVRPLRPVLVRLAQPIGANDTTPLGRG